MLLGERPGSYELRFRLGAEICQTFVDQDEWFGWPLGWECNSRSTVPARFSAINNSDRFQKSCPDEDLESQSSLKKRLLATTNAGFSATVTH